MDNFYKPGLISLFKFLHMNFLLEMTEEEGLAAIKKCIDQCAKRAIIHFTGFRAIVINADGTRIIDGLKSDF